MYNLDIEEKDSLPEGYDIAVIDSKKCTTLRAFYETMAKVFEFPDYFGFNMDSFDEMLNDLSWIENDKIVMYFDNSESFLVAERNDTKILTLLDILEATCEDWKWFEGDDDVPKKELLIRFSRSERMEVILEELY